MSGQTPSIYLDYAATTPVDARVAAKISAVLQDADLHANPASAHGAGQHAHAAIELARRHVADLVGAAPTEIVWTSGATEADNLAIKGAAYFYRQRGRHLVTSRTEHKAVLDSCRQLEREGWKVTYLVPGRDGLLSATQLQQAIGKDTVLVSIMHVNNETGVIQDIDALGRVCRERGVLFHSDAAQSAAVLPIDLRTLPVDLMSFSAHKAYGPKGVGALFVRERPRVRVEAIIHGGGHEQGMRSGTLATHQIAGMGEAFRIVAAERNEYIGRMRALRERLWLGLSQISGVSLNGHAAACAASILNVTFEGVHGESLLLGLPGLFLSGGAACTSTSGQPSYVLRALGRDDQAAQSSLRLSLGRNTSATEVDQAVARIKAAVERLRARAPERLIGARAGAAESRR